MIEIPCPIGRLVDNYYESDLSTNISTVRFDEVVISRIAYHSD